MTQLERMSTPIWNRQEVMFVRHGHEGLGDTYHFLRGLVGRDQMDASCLPSPNSSLTATSEQHKAIRLFRCQDAGVQHPRTSASHSPTAGPETRSSVQNSRPAPQPLDGSADRPPHHTYRVSGAAVHGGKVLYVRHRSLDRYDALPILMPHIGI